MKFIVKSLNNNHSDLFRYVGSERLRRVSIINDICKFDNEEMLPK